MGRMAQSRLEELRLCKLPMSWMDDEEVIDLLDELHAARETILHPGELEKQLAAQAAELAKLRERLAAAEAKWAKCYTAVVLAYDAYCLGVEINANTPRRHKAIEATSHLVLAKANAKPSGESIAAGWIPPSTKGEG